MSLIKLEQKPIINFSKLSEVGKEIKEEIGKYNISDLIVAEDTLKDIKALRAKFNNQFKEYEASRKAIKTAVNDPYKQFEDAYKEHISSQYKNADETLKEVINEVEDGLRLEKKNKLIDYYKDQAVDLDFVSFDQIGLNITLSASMKSLETKIDEFIEKVKNDLKLIELEEHKERILVRYKSSLDVSDAIISVKGEIAQEEAIKAVIEQEKPVIEAVTTEKTAEEEVKVEEVENTEILNMTFTVSGTIEQLKLVKNFLDKEGIKYE